MALTLSPSLIICCTSSKYCPEALWWFGGLSAAAIAGRQLRRAEGSNAAVLNDGDSGLYPNQAIIVLCRQYASLQCALPKPVVCSARGREHTYRWWARLVSFIGTAIDTVQCIPDMQDSCSLCTRLRATAHCCSPPS
jgi:hypothetical protein